MKKIICLLAFLVIIGFGVIGGLCYWGQLEYQKSGTFAADKIIVIEANSPTKAIAGTLMAQGLLDGRGGVIFRLAAKLQGASLKAGEYEFKAQSSSIKDIIELLRSGRVYQHKVTIAEGLTAMEIITLLQGESGLTGALAALPAEGTLLPETYYYTYGMTRQMIVERMQKAMRETLAALWESRTADTVLKTPEEAVVLASIVEKETGLAAERPRVAGVFINRLRRNMPLQSDPTVIYAVTGGQVKLDRALSLADLKTPSPYNTYKVRGLPPSPIANVGKAALEAVLHPEAHDYLYFVADGTGGHAFAKTLAEHNNNVAKWRKIQK
jgi:UPF0755 protein